ncbi:hypothetical protein HNQ44_001018 [Planomicrobium koreense]|uniref:Uncharacterized protein n=1 Tax=Planococcus koreensis TaxID=112331 RepID=A0A7W8CRL6_9BACL|nr:MULTISPECIES: hypothetical protein [Planococcus]MBB5179594.1 hypothetical protein [Planococcus koreensis]MDN3448764.1 hypothetical protein [Planococcus sp. APC 3906]
MATKWKNDLWSITAVIIALFSLLYCCSFILDMIKNTSTADLLASLRLLSKGDI